MPRLHFLKVLGPSRTVEAFQALSFASKRSQGEDNFATSNSHALQKLNTKNLRKPFSSNHRTIAKIHENRGSQKPQHKPLNGIAILRPWLRHSFGFHRSLHDISTNDILQSHTPNLQRLTNR